MGRGGYSAGGGASRLLCSSNESKILVMKAKYTRTKMYHVSACNSFQRIRYYFQHLTMTLLFFNYYKIGEVDVDENNQIESDCSCINFDSMGEGGSLPMKR
jgi:hypothetical protein